MKYQKIKKKKKKLITVTIDIERYISPEKRQNVIDNLGINLVVW